MAHLEREFAGRHELDTVLLKVASRCNIDCSYCYVYHLGDTRWRKLDKFMSEETLSAVCEKLGELAQRQELPFAVVLHGGEPLLLGLERFEELVSSLRSVLPERYPISMQTNGILLSNAFLDICALYQVSISVSLDGPERIHDRERIRHDGSGTFAEVMQGVNLLANHPDAGFLYTGLLAVVDPESDPGEIYAFFKSLKVPKVDFLYRDGNHSKLPSGKSGFESTEFGRWMARLFDIYIDDHTPIVIRILDDLTKAVLGGFNVKEGLGLSDFGILIVDTDGTLTKNDTLKSAFPGADQFTRQVKVGEVSLFDFLRSPEFVAYRKMQRPDNALCAACPELAVCGGGMILHRWKDGSAFDNPSVYCHDQQFLIQHIRKRVLELMPAYV